MYDNLELMYRLRICDFDSHEHLLPSAILDLFTDIATIQAEDMGMGLDSMRDRNYMWAVIRTRYEQLAQPKLHEEVLVRTWPHTPTRFSFLRDYTITAEDGTPYVRATSEWVIMNFESREFVSCKEAYDGPSELCEDRCFDRKPKKLHDFEAVGEGVLVVPTWTDLDINGHVNNAKYAKYVADQIDVPDGRFVKTLQIDYRKELACGEPVRIHVLPDAEAEAVQAKGLDPEGAVHFSAFFEFGE